MPVSMFKNVPDWSFYIETPQHDKLEGILYTSLEDCDDNKEYTFPVIVILGLYRDMKNYSFVRIYTSGDAMPVEELKNEIIGDSLLADLIMKQLLGSSGTASADATLELTAVAIPLLAYLCSKTTEIPVEIVRPRTVRKKCPNQIRKLAQGIL